jgi:hypothetical protein
MRNLLNKFLDENVDILNIGASEKLLYLTYFFTEVLKHPFVTTKDLKILFDLADLPTPSNFGGEIKYLLRRKKLIKTKRGYKLNRSVKKNINKTKEKSILKIGTWEYINEDRINQLQSLNCRKFDFTKFIRFCEELNHNFRFENFLSCTMLVRAILDHVPPIFGFNNFNEVVNNHGTKSFKSSMQNLNKSSRKIADCYLHTTIRSKEVLPNSNQVDFSNDLDVLLAEVYRILKQST